MANNFPCNTTPVKFISCCDVMDCIDIKSSDNSVTVEKSGCGVDITQTGNNLDQILELTDSGCITWVKEFIDGVLTYTPQLNIGCIEEEIDIDNLITVANGNCITFVKTVVGKHQLQFVLNVQKLETNKLRYIIITISRRLYGGSLCQCIYIAYSPLLDCRLDGRECSV